VSVIVRGKNARKPYTVRHWVDGRQRERSFAKLKGNDGAEAFKTKIDHELRAQIYVDDRAGREKFADAAAAWAPPWPRCLTLGMQRATLRRET
jgi:hypothetical protein